MSPERLHRGYAGQKDDSHPGQGRAGCCEISSCYPEWHTIKNLCIISGIFPLKNFGMPWKAEEDCCKKNLKTVLTIKFKMVVFLRGRGQLCLG